MTTQTFNLGDPVRQISTGKLATIFGLVGDGPPYPQYWLSIKGWCDPSSGAPNYERFGPIAASDIEARAAVFDPATGMWG